MVDNNSTSTVDEQMSAALGPRVEPPKPSTSPYTMQSLFTPKDTPAVKTDEAEVTTAPTPIPFTEVTFGGKGLLGTGMAVERKVPIDWTLTTPELSIKDVLPFDDEEYRNRFMTYNEYENAQGEVVDVTGMSIEDRINVADRFGAVRFGIYTDDYRITADIPWEDAVSKFTRFPDGVQIAGGPIRFETQGMTRDQYENLVMANRFGSTMLNPSPELGRAIHAQYLNEMLIKNGIDARGRALIINQEMEEYGVNQLGRIVSGASETIGRGTIEMGLWAVGETADWMNWAGEGLGLLGETDMSGTVADYKTRQGVMDDMWKPTAYRVQDSFAQQNVIIDLSTAEDLVDAHSGLVPRALALGIEIATPTKAVLLKNGLTSTGEVRAFRTWREGQLKKRPDMTEDALLEEWKANRTDLFGFIAAREKTIDDRFAMAMQIEDSTLPVAERALVIKQQTYTTNLFRERDAAARQLEKAQDNVNVSEAELSRLRSRVRKLDSQIQTAQVDLLAVQRRSSVPEFIRQSGIQDRFIIAGAAVGGHLFEDYADNVDSELGELLGLGVGIKLYVGKGVFSPALNAIRRTLTRDKRKKLTFIADRMSQLDPTMQIAVELQATKLANYKQKLLDLGVDPLVLDTPLEVVTDLMTLRHFTEATMQRVSVNGVLDADVVRNLQESADLQRRLSGQLNGIISQMREGDVNDATNTLIDTLSYFRDEAQGGFNKLQGYLNTVDKEGIGHYMNALSGNSAAITGKGPLVQNNSDVLSFPEALDALHDRNLAQPIDEVALKTQIDDHDTFVNGEVTNAARAIISRAGDVNAARLSIEAAEDASIPSGITTGGLFSFIVENAHSSAKAKAQAPYKALDNNAVFVSTGGQEFAAGTLTADVRDIFDDVFAITEQTLPITIKEGKGIRPSDLRTLDDTLASVTDSFFDSMAEATGVSKSEFVDGLLDGINEQRAAADLPALSVPKGRNKQVFVAQSMLEYSDIDAFRVTPATLLELQRSVGQMRYRLARNADAQQRLSSVDSMINDKFNQFEAEGVSVGELYVSISGGPRKPLTTYMDEANANYATYKANWYDTNENAVIPRLMSWGDRKKTNMTADNPTGVRYNKLTNEWLIPAQYADETSAKRFMASVNRTLGKVKLLSDGTEDYRLVLGEGNTQAVQTVLSADIGKYVSDNINNMTTEQLIEYVTNTEKNLRAVDATGKDMPLVNVVAVVDEVLKASDKTYKKDLWDAATSSVNTKIKDTVAVATRGARSQLNATKTALDVLTNVYGRNMTLEDFGRAIAAGNANDIRGFKQVLSDATVMSDVLDVMSVDDILSSAYMEYMQSRIFPTTGRSIGQSVKNDKGDKVFSLSPEYDTNLAALKDALGGDDSARQSAVRSIIGDERYKVWKTMYDYLVEMQDNPLARNSSVLMQGAPRSLSIESYISRLYAINRGVVRPQYVGTEATIQALRNKNFKFLQAALTDPELGNLFIDMIRTNKPLSVKQSYQLESLLIQAYGQQLGLEGGIKETPIVDPAGRTFTSYATPAERERFIGDSRITGQLDIPSLDVIPQAP